MPCSSHASRFAPHALALLGLAFAPATASAADITLQGTFARDDQVQLFDVTTAAPGSVDIRSFGYGGGTTATGMVPRGGFDNILTLFDAAGTLITDNDDGAGAAIDPSTGIAGDARITTTLAPGGYVVALTQFDNFALGPTLADGFYEAGYPNFTADPFFSSAAPCPSGLFRDVSGSAGRCRTGDWTVDFVGVTSATPVSPAPVPEPASSLALLGGRLTGLLGLAGLTRTAARRGRRRSDCGEDRPAVTK
jgi:hypothetical protein